VRNDDRGNQRTPAAHAPLAGCEAHLDGAVAKNLSISGGLGAL
jgi:hypothetical protein